MDWQPYTFIRWGLLVISIVGLLLTTLVRLNINTLLQEKGMDRLLVNNWDWITRLGQNPLFTLLVGFFIGGAFFIWADYFLGQKKWERVYANIPTSIRVQFTAGSNQANQLANENIRNFFGERAQFNFYSENNELMDVRVVWYVFLTFKQPTSYGQIMVDAGNAVIPEYQIVHQNYFSAILRFNGDIGNVALAIKTVPANPSE